MKENNDTKLLKGAFKDNGDLLKMIRKLLFGFDTTESERDLIKATFQSKELKEAFRKKIFALFGDDVELGHIGDFWQIPEDRIVGEDINSLKQIVATRKGVAILFAQAMDLLDEPKDKAIDLSYDPDSDDELLTNLLIRNRYINAIEGALGGINAIVNGKAPTLEEIEARMKKDSTK